MNKIKVVCVEPMKSAYVKEINSGFEALQKEVGGIIQAIYPFDDSAAIICNDEGKLMNLPLNRALRDDNGEMYDIIAGTFIIIGAPLGSSDFGSLSEEQVEVYLEQYKNYQNFMRFGNDIKVFEFQK